MRLGELLSLLPLISWWLCWKKERGGGEGERKRREEEKGNRCLGKTLLQPLVNLSRNRKEGKEGKRENGKKKKEREERGRQRKGSMEILGGVPLFFACYRQTYSAKEGAVRGEGGKKKKKGGSISTSFSYLLHGLRRRGGKGRWKGSVPPSR